MGGPYGPPILFVTGLKRMKRPGLLRSGFAGKPDFSVSAIAERLVIRLAASTKSCRRACPRELVALCVHDRYIARDYVRPVVVDFYIGHVSLL